MLSHIGSFTNIRGGWAYPGLVRKSSKEPKNIKVYLQDGVDDLNNLHGNWPLANQQMADTFTANPDLDAFILIGGWAQFAPQAYTQVTDQVMDKLKSKDLIIIAGDTLPPQTKAFRDGRSHAQVGQRPFEMGYRAPDVMIQLINGEAVDDPLYTGLDVCNQDDAGFCADN